MYVFLSHSGLDLNWIIVFSLGFHECLIFFIIFLNEDNPGKRCIEKQEVKTVLKYDLHYKGKLDFCEKKIFSLHLNNVCFENYDRLLDFHSFPYIGFQWKSVKADAKKRVKKINVLLHDNFFDKSTFVLFEFFSILSFDSRTFNKKMMFWYLYLVTKFIDNGQSKPTFFMAHIQNFKFYLTPFNVLFDLAIYLQLNHV